MSDRAFPQINEVGHPWVNGPVWRAGARERWTRLWDLIARRDSIQPGCSSIVDQVEALSRVDVIQAWRAI